jgi:hypothetical protein
MAQRLGERRLPAAARVDRLAADEGIIRKEDLAANERK